MKSEISNLIICGADCSGKSTLYWQIHKLTKYRWNLHDRSTLSMLVHSRQYNRPDADKWRQKLSSELRNLNNFMIILHPSWEVIKSRFSVRGDDIQNLDSLNTVYMIFEEEIANIEKFPNVLVIRG